jgi:Zn-dependent peptidase ImmA (M78 family)
MGRVPDFLTGVEFLPETRLERRVAELLARYQRSQGTLCGFPIPVEEMVEIMEGLPVVSLSPADQFEANILGAYEFRTKTIYMNDRIDHEGRRRFTLAHEYGHHVLHAPFYSQSSFDFGETAAEQHRIVWRGVVDKHNQVEVQANKFAAHLLMPSGLTEKEFRRIEGEVGSVQAPRAFADLAQVSLEAAMIRLTQLNLQQATPGP